MKKVITWHDVVTKTLKAILHIVAVIAIFMAGMLFAVSCTTSKQIVSSDNLVKERLTIESDSQSGIYNSEQGLIYFYIPSNIDWNILINDYHNNQLDNYIIINGVLMYKNQAYYDWGYEE
jgi:hypothetical protein